MEDSFLIVFWDVVKFVDDFKTLLSLELVCKSFGQALYSLKGSFAKQMYQTILFNNEKKFHRHITDVRTLMIHFGSAPESMILSLFAHFCEWNQTLSLRSRPACWYSIILTWIKYRSALPVCYSDILFEMAHNDIFQNEPSLVDIQLITIYQIIEKSFHFPFIFGVIGDIITHRQYMETMLDRLPEKWQNTTPQVIEGLNFIKNNIQILQATKNNAHIDDSGGSTAYFTFTFGGIISPVRKQARQTLYYDNN